MKLEQQLFIFVSIFILIIFFIFVTLVNFTNAKIDSLQENEIDTNKVLIGNLKSVYEGINILVKQIDLVLPKIHKELLNNNIDIKNKKDEIFYYENYGYKYLIFNKDSVFRKIYSGFSNVRTNFDIESKFLKLIEKDTIHNNLELGQIVNRVFKINGEEYIFSMKYLFTREGKINGGVVVLVRLKLFIDLENIVSYKNIYILNLNNNIYYKNNDIIHNNIKNKILNNKKNNTNETLEIKNIKFNYKYNKYLDLYVVSYIEKEEIFEKNNIFNFINLSIFCIVIIMVISTSIYNKWIVNKADDSIKLDIVSQKIPNNYEIKLKEINGYYFNIYNDMINNLNEYKTSENILKVKTDILELKTIMQNIDKELNNLNELESAYKNLEINGNMLEINISILCNQLEDERLNDLLLIIKKLNQKLRDTNLENILNISNKLEYNNLFTILEKIYNSLESLHSIDKNRINILNNLKIKLKEN